MDDHPYYLRQRSNAFPVASVSISSVTSVTAPIASSNTVSRHLVPTVWSGPTQLPTQSFIISHFKLLRSKKIIIKF